MPSAAEHPANASETLTLSEFLLARIAEDEETAQAAHRNWPGPWTYSRERGEVWHSGDNGAYDRPYVTNADGHLADEHIARHDPARVLAECEAKRRILRTPALHMFGDPGQPISKAGRPVLQALASAYADHPDYRDEWKP